MSENTETINPSDPDIQESRAKLLHDLSDVSNPATQNLIRQLFADFCKIKKAEEVKKDPAPEDLNNDIQKAIKDVLRKHNISRAECSIEITYNTSEQKPAPEPETASKSEPETAPEAASNEAATSATTSAAEEKRSTKDVALDNIIAWSDRQLTRVPCDGIDCNDGCPICLKIAGHLICMKCEIQTNVEKFKEERNSHV